MTDEKDVFEKDDIISGTADEAVHDAASDDTASDESSLDRIMRIIREVGDEESDEESDDVLTTGENGETVEIKESDDEELPDEDIDYKATLKKLKAEYKAVKKEERSAKAKEREARTGYGARLGITVLIAVLSTLLCFVLLTVFVFLFPTRDSSLFATMAKRYARKYDYNSSQGTSKIGDNEIEPGSNVTINVDGEFSAAAAYAKASDSVVAIVTVRVGKDAEGNTVENAQAQGAGVVISEDGEILTNNHVINSVIDTATGGIAEGFKIYIYFDSPRSRPYEVTSIIGYDPEFDLALIKIDRNGLKPIEFFDSDNLTVGESVIAIGSPGGIEFMGSVCDGIISGLKRTITSSDSGAILYDMIQMTTPINPGNSGGAVVNSKGQLVGISVIKIVADNYENMGFAISSNTASRIIKSFRQYGRYVKPLLGVTINTVYGWRDADENGWPLGCLVVEVSENSGAFKAGIKKDDIICQIDGVDSPDYTSLRTRLLRFAPDDEVVFKVYRPSEDKYYEFTVKLTAA